MNQIILKARAKINLTLDVIDKREDGFHNVEMIMQTINLYDTLSIRKMKKDGIQLITNLKWLPIDNRNLAYKAANILKERYNLKDGIFIDLKKHIPVSAGLAGGSTDAAATLIGIKRLFNLNLTTTELMNIGKELGADVPYCIMRGTALAQGIGDKLTRLPSLNKIYVVLVKPPISVSTGYIYNLLDSYEIDKRPDTNLVIEAIKNNDIYTVAKNMYNVMEKVTAEKYPIINRYKEFLIKKGAIGSVMSGSGPTVFGLFDNKSKAEEAYYRLKLDENIRDAFVTTIF